MPEIVAGTPEPQRLPSEQPQVRLGEWYWLDTEEHDIHYKKMPSRPRLWCVVDIGSNHVKLRRNRSTYRVHFRDFGKECRHEPDAPRMLREEVAEHQALASATVRKIEELCRRLGLTEVLALPEKAGVATGTDIVPAAQGADIGRYKRALTVAKDKTLPQLFEDLKRHNENLAEAMTAESMSLVAYAGKLNERLAEVKTRIFHVELYAGMAEEVVHVAKGDPAPMAEKIRVLQRRLYMDEESLLDYDSGGMNFTRLSAFDDWMSRPHNLARLLPFTRCVAAFRTRRNPKAYSDLDPFVRFSFDNADARTYLYIRNGDNLYRLATDIDFGPRMFPGRMEFDFTQPIHAKMRGESVDRIYTEGEVEAMRAERAKAAALQEAWRAANPGKDVRFDAPYETRRQWESCLWDADDPANLRRFCPDDVFYDDIRRHFQEQVDAYNRIVVVIQGLLDRSPIFHPHPPLKLWREADNEFILPVYDDEMALYGGEKPDFAAYQASLNKGIKVGSMVVGQRAYWNVVIRHPDKRKANEDLPYRRAVYGDNGPALVDKVVRRRRAACDFMWERDRAWSRSWRANDGPVKSWLRNVPMSWLLNVDAYTPGDFRPFFADPRTRAEYLQWAGLLLNAEKYKAGGKEEDS